MDDPQSLRAGTALAPDRFCVAIHEMQPDDPFSIVLHFDGRLEQPWGRIDVRRNIADLVAPPDPNARNCIGVSDEGDVYEFDDARSTPPATKIPGAGVYSEDANGSGPITGLAFLDGRLHAFGTSGQLYRQSGEGGWKILALEDASIARSGRIAAMASAGDGTMLMAGTIEPGYVETPEHLQRAQLEAAQAGDLERFQELSRQADEWRATAGGGGVNTGFLARTNGEGWRRIDLDTGAELLDAVWDGTSFWAVGHAGTVLKAGPSGAVENLTHADDRFLNLTGVAPWDRTIVAISDFELHAWSGSGLDPFEPALPVEPGEPARPLRVEAVGDTLFVFDGKQGIYRLSGDRWDHIAIPPELLEREFRGLPANAP